MKWEEFHAYQTLACATLALALTSGPAFAQSGELTIWSWNIAASSLKATIAGFNKQFPDVKVTVEDLGNQPVYDKSIAGCAAGGEGLPDIVSIENFEAENYWSQFPDCFVDLQDARLHGRGPGEIPRLQAHRARSRRRGLCDAVGFRPGRHVLSPRFLREGRRRSGLDQDLGRFHRRRQEDPGGQSGRRR